MDETRRTLRFALPGLTAGLVLFLLLSLAGPEDFEPFRYFGKEGAVTTAVASLLASGALGFLGAQVYFFLHWSCLPVFGPVDHTAAAGIIRSREPGWVGSTARFNSHSQATLKIAWATVTSWWFVTKGKDKRLASATERTTSLMDHAHSAGVLSCTIALTTTLWLCVCIADHVSVGRVVGGLIGSVVVILAMYSNWANTRRLFEQVVEETIDWVTSHPDTERPCCCPCCAKKDASDSIDGSDAAPSTGSQHGTDAITE
jgi:hypothetical protein